MRRFNRKGELPEPRVLIIAVAILIIFAPVAFVLLMNPTPSYSPTITNIGASYIMSNSGGVYYATNGATGVADYSGSNASTVFTSALSTPGLVTLTAGTYILSSYATIGVNNITIRGSQGSIISTIGMGNYSAFQATNKNGITLESLNFNNVGRYGLDGSYLNNIKVESCSFNSMGIGGVQLKYSHNITISNNHLSNNGWQHVDFSGDVQLWDSSAAVISNNICYNRLTSSYNSPCIGARDSMGKVVIEGNYVDGSLSNGILAFDAQGIVINDNSIHHVGQSGIYLEDCPNSTTSGNSISYCTATGIVQGWWITGSPYSTCIGNTIQETGSSGIVTAHYSIVSDNTIINSNLIPSTFGTFGDCAIAANCWHSIISNNIINDTHMVKNTKYAVSDRTVFSTLANNNSFINNEMMGGFGIAGFFIDGKNEVVHGNMGWNTESTGYVAILTGAGGADYVHHLDVPPGVSPNQAKYIVTMSVMGYTYCMIEEYSDATYIHISISPAASGDIMIAVNVQAIYN